MVPKMALIRGNWGLNVRFCDRDPEKAHQNGGMGSNLPRPHPVIFYFIFFRLPRISRKSSDTDTVYNKKEKK